MTDQHRPFTEKYGPWALIAGGSEGIGSSFAEQLAERGLNLILLARRDAALQQTAQHIRARHAVQVRTHSIDLTAPDLAHTIDTLCAGLDIGLLIYNAGATHGAELFLDAPLAQALNLVQLNCTGPLTLAHRIGSRLRERGRGGIILLSSMSALAGTGYVAAYAATKSFDMIFAEGLWAELRPYGVDVLGLVAGATRTPAMQRAGAQFGVGSNGEVEPNTQGMDPDDVAREALKKLGDGPILFPGELNRAAAEAIRQAPRAAAIEAMSGAAAAMHEKPWPPR